MGRDMGPLTPDSVATDQVAEPDARFYVFTEVFFMHASHFGSLTPGYWHYVTHFSRNPHKGECHQSWFEDMIRGRNQLCQT